MKIFRMLFVLSLINILIFAEITNAQSSRNYLSGNVNEKSLDSIISIDNSWIKFPAYTEREKWNEIPTNLREGYIKKAEGLIDYNWPTIKASQFLEFEKSGNRRVFERTYKERIKALEYLVLAELLEGKGQFIDAIVDGIWSFCEQTYWGLSAHVRLQPSGRGLPNVEDRTIDLGTGTVASLLVWTNYFLKDEFDKINPFISKRITYEVRQKVLEPYYNRVDLWWMGFGTRRMMNNWNPWVNYNVLNCILLTEEDRSLKNKNIYKVMTSLDKFINYYKDDGGCEEGPSYWQHAGGMLLESLDLLHKVSDGKIDIFEKELIKNMGKYIYQAYIGNNYFINFADATNRIHLKPYLIYLYGERINDPILKKFASYIAHNEDDSEFVDDAGPLEFTLNSLFRMNDILKEEPVEPLLDEFWLEQTQVMGIREKAGSKDGFYFSAIGGHNDESHNHNDVGSFILYYNGYPFIVDAGVGTYTKKTFSSERYELWNMQSQYHNLPTINGVMQNDGLEYEARNIKHNSNQEGAQFSLDIAAAYPDEAMVNIWERSYSFKRNDALLITDRYSLTKNNGETYLNFISNYPVEIFEDGVIKFDSGKDQLFLIYDDEQLEPSFESIDIDDERLNHSWPMGLNRIRLKIISMKTEGEVSLKFVKSYSK